MARVLAPDLKWTRLALAASCAVLAFALGGGAAAKSDPPKAASRLPGRIIYGDHLGVYSVRPDGSGLGRSRILRYGNPNYATSFSRNGHRFAYARFQYDTQRRLMGIGLVDSRGGHNLRVVDQGAKPSRGGTGPLGLAAWSPDGNHIAYNLEYGALGDRAVAVVSATGGPRKLLAPSDGDPTWAPDGQHVLVAGETEERPRCQIQPGESECSSPVDPCPWRSGLLELGLDGTKRVFFRDASLRQLATPVWSPNGKDIAFVVDRACDGQTMELWVMDSSGSSPRRLASMGKNIGVAPAWSPDSRYLAYFRDTSNPYRPTIYSVAAAGGASRVVAKRVHRVGEWLSWYPR